MYRDFQSKMSTPAMKSKATGSGLRPIESGSDSGYVLFSKTKSKRTSDAIIEYCRQTLVKLKQTEEFVGSLEELGKEIGSVNDDRKLLDSAKAVYDNVSDIQKLLDNTKLETTQLRVTLDELTSELRSHGNRSTGNTSPIEREYTVSSFSDQDLSSDSDECPTYHIYSTQSLSDGRMIFPDYWNKKLKLLDTSQRVSHMVTNALKCKGTPWGLCEIKGNEFAVTLTDARCIMIITIDGDTAKVTKEIAVDEPCRGISHHKGNFYVACAGFGNDEGKGHLRIIGSDGKQIVIKESKSGKQIFSRPRQIYVNTVNEEVFVTDADDMVVLDLHGNEIRRIKDEKLQSPFGICDDGRGGVLVSGFVSNNVCRVDSPCEQVVELIPKGQVHSPVSLYLHPKTAILYVGMERNKCIKCYRVEK